MAEAHRAFFALDPADAVTFNKDQRIVIVGTEVTPAVRQMALFLGHKRAACHLLGIRLLQDNGETLLSTDIVVGAVLPAAPAAPAWQENNRLAVPGRL